MNVVWKHMKTHTFLCFITPEIAVALHCTNIRELTLNVKRGILNGLTLWEIVKSSLKILRLGINYSADEEMGEIQKHCQKSRSISGYSPGSNTSFAQLIASYGAQLELARIWRMDANDLEYVVTRCPNAMFTLASKETDVPNMNIIGKQLKEVLIFKYCDLNHQLPDSTGTWDLCPNLQTISIQKKVGDVDVRAMLLTPKQFLKRLVLGIAKFSTFTFIANKVTTLEVVRFKCSFPPGNVFKSLISNN